MSRLDLLVQKMRALPEIHNLDKWRGTHQADRDWWSSIRRNIRDRFNSRIYPNTKEQVDIFLQWPEIVSTMVFGAPECVNIELDFIRDWYAYPRAVLEDEVGQPQLRHAENGSSPNLVHAACAIKVWENTTGRKITDLQSIVEIGGGYGAMAKVIRRAGYTGKYVIYDFPELSLLQEYYLSECGIKDIECAVNLPEIETSHELMIGLWSLSEMFEPDQTRFLSSLKAKHHLFAYNDVDWQGFDSRAVLLAFPHTKVPSTHNGSYYLAS